MPKKKNKVGRPRKYKGGKLDSYGIHPEQREWLQKKAEEQGVYMTDIIRNSVWRAMAADGIDIAQYGEHLRKFMP